MMLLFHSSRFSSKLHRTYVASRTLVSLTYDDSFPLLLVQFETKTLQQVEILGKSDVEAPFPLIWVHFVTNSTGGVREKETTQLHQLHASLRTRAVLQHWCNVMEFKTRRYTSIVERAPSYPGLDSSKTYRDLTGNEKLQPKFLKKKQTRINAAFSRRYVMVWILTLSGISAVISLLNLCKSLMNLAPANH